MVKVGDKVRIKKGLVGEGMIGEVEKIAPWNLDSPYPDLREDFYWLLFEDGVRYHVHHTTVEEVG